jgi:hypothetical protein
MKTPIPALCCGLFLAASVPAEEPCRTPLDVVQPRVPDRLCRVTLDGHELGGEIDRRIRNLVYNNYLVVDLDGNCRNRSTTAHRRAESP